MNRIGVRAFALLLCLALVFAFAAPAFAEEASEAAAPVAAEESAKAAVPVTADGGSILDSAAISALVDDYLAKKGIPKDRVGIGFCYTATGDEWYLNPDTWFYPGSMYKVPLMMDLSERLRSGEVSEDTQIGGLNLDTLYEYILVYSNNDYAHKVRSYLGGDEVWREEVKDYAGLDRYDERYMLYCYFSPRYITHVMETLYQQPERFPKVLDNLLKAEQGHYFRLPDEMHVYDVAQKYGSYIDNETTNWNHTTGIIYTPNPIIVTVMTRNVGGAEAVIGQIGALLKDYALTLDDTLAAYREEQERAEAERLAAEEAARLAAEAPQTTTQPKSRQLVPQQTLPQSDGPATLLPTQTPDRAMRGYRAGIRVLLILLGAAILGGIGSVILVKERERRRYESYKRRFEEELRQETLEREQARRRETQRAQNPAPAQRSQAAPAAQRPQNPAPAQRPQAAPAAQRPQNPAPAQRSQAAPAAQRPQNPAPAQTPRPGTPIRPQPPRERKTPVFDEDQWLNDEENE